MHGVPAARRFEAFKTGLLRVLKRCNDRLGIRPRNPVLMYIEGGGGYKVSACGLEYSFGDTDGSTRGPKLGYRICAIC